MRVNDALPLAEPFTSAGDTVMATPLVGLVVLTVSVYVLVGGGLLFEPPPPPPHALKNAARVTAAQKFKWCRKAFISVLPAPIPGAIASAFRRGEHTVAGPLKKRFIVYVPVRKSEQNHTLRAQDRARALQWKWVTLDGGDLVLPAPFP